MKIVTFLKPSPVIDGRTFKAGATAFVPDAAVFALAEGGFIEPPAETRIESVDSSAPPLVLATFTRAALVGTWHFEPGQRGLIPPGDVRPEPEPAPVPNRGPTKRIKLLVGNLSVPIPLKNGYRSTERGDVVETLSWKAQQLVDAGLAENVPVAAESFAKPPRRESASAASVK